jgi:2',3'-cyclic-nucleotide 2'-phosphodiesterase (5'-nucleotidase family)
MPLAITALSMPAQGARQRVGARDDVLRVHLLYTNDMHGYLAKREAGFMNPEFPPTLGGAASAAAYIKRIREEAAAAGEGCLLLDAGDLFQGTRLGEETQGGAVVEWMNRMGYDALVLGNHDFDLGWKNAKRLATMCDFPALGANVIVEENGQRVDWVKPYTMVETAGVRFGILGLITLDTKTMVGKEQLAGVDFRPVDDAAREFVPRMQQEGAEVVMVLGHMGVPPGFEEKMAAVEKNIALPPEERRKGLNAQEFVHAVPGVDLLVGGHIHWGLRKPYEDPVTHSVCFQTYARLSGVGHMILLIDRETHTFAGWEQAHSDGTEVTLFTDYVWPDPEHEAQIDAVVARAEAGMDQVICMLKVNLGRGQAEHILGQVVSDAFRESADADIAFSNRGGIRRELRRGAVTPRDLYEVLPFNNELEMYTVSGEVLRQILETGVSGNRHDLELSGAQLVVDQALPNGEKLVEIEVGGEPLDPDRQYRVVTTSYLAQGSIGWDILTEHPAEPVGMNDLEAAVRYFRAHNPMVRKFVPRIERLHDS